MKNITIVFLVFFFLMNPDTWALAKEKPAGKIIRLKGSALIVREGKELDTHVNVKIFQSDVVKTGPDSLVELLLLDGSSFIIGPESSLGLSHYKFGLNEDNPNFICRMVKGVFVYISGAISKLHPKAVKFETPDGTVAIRGTKLVVRIIEADSISSTAGETFFILLKDPNGKVGQVIIFNRYGKSTLNKEKHYVTINGDKSPIAQKFMDPKTMKQMIPEILYPFVFENYKPPLAYTEAFESLIDQSRIFVFPKRDKPISISAP